MRTFNVTLTGAQETQPNLSLANGTGTIVWDTTTDSLRYQFTVYGLDFGPVAGQLAQTPDPTDDVTGMHFHNGTRGADGPIVFGQFSPAQDTDDLNIARNPDGSWTVGGTWETTDLANQPITNFATVLDTTAVSVDAPLYWNVHTASFPLGVIRGQLIAATDLI